MEGKRGEEGSPTGTPGRGEVHERQTCGPLDIERHRKEDGRALILYSATERGQP